MAIIDKEHRYSDPLERLNSIGKDIFIDKKESSEEEIKKEDKKEENKEESSIK